MMKMVSFVGGFFEPAIPASKRPATDGRHAEGDESKNLADFVTDNLWSFKLNGTDDTLFDGTNFTDFINWTDIINTDFGDIDNISSFAQDGAGNLYIIGLDGEILLLAGIPEPSAAILLPGFGILPTVRRRR